MSEPEKRDEEAAQVSAPEEPAPAEAGDTSPTQQTASRTRASGLWTALAFAVLVLLLLLIFILQNLQPVTVTYFSARGQLPLGVGLLLAAVGGALVVLVSGIARILQLRRMARRNRRQDKKRNNQR